MKTKLGGIVLSSEKIKHKPKLYISQPISQSPDIMMQRRYSTRNATPVNQPKDEQLFIEKNADMTLEDVETGDLHSQEGTSVQSSVEVESTSNPFDTKRKKQYSFQRVKNFKEMTIDEKLTYLENFPEQLEPVPCLFFTPNTTYTGILHRKTDDKIDIILPNHTQKTISKKELHEIRMLGFH
jgi:hypothetical protein